jgi:hypothetical protein
VDVSPKLLVLIAQLLDILKMVLKPELDYLVVLEKPSQENAELQSESLPEEEEPTNLY